jgi:hypothetical protein
LIEPSRELAQHSKIVECLGNCRILRTKSLFGEIERAVDEWFCFCIAAQYSQDSTLIAQSLESQPGKVFITFVAGLIYNSHGPFVAHLSVRVIAASLIDRAEIAEHGCDIGMICAFGLLKQREGATEEPLALIASSGVASGNRLVVQPAGFDDNRVEVVRVSLRSGFRLCSRQVHFIPL